MSFNRDPNTHPRKYKVRDVANPGFEIEVNELEFGRAVCKHLREYGLCKSCYAIPTPNHGTRTLKCGNPLGCFGHLLPYEHCVTRYGLHLYVERMNKFAMQTPGKVVDTRISQNATRATGVNDVDIAHWILQNCDHSLNKEIERAAGDNSLWGTSDDIARIRATDPLPRESYKAWGVPEARSMPVGGPQERSMPGAYPQKRSMPRDYPQQRPTPRGYPQEPPMHGAFPPDDFLEQFRAAGERRTMSSRESARAAMRGGGVPDGYEDGTLRRKSSWD